MSRTFCNTKCQELFVLQKHKTATLRSRLLLTKSGCLFDYILSPAQTLVVETVVFMRGCGILCPTLPLFTKVRFIVQLTCRGR